MYTPAGSTPGSNTPVPDAIAGDHTPPKSAPPNNGNKSVVPSVLHATQVLFVPGFGGLFTVTVTVAAPFGQPFVPVTV